MSLSDINIKKIVKFVETLYTPAKIMVRDIEISGEKEIIIGVYFDEISDKYISVPYTRQVNKNKEENMTMEIRKSIHDFLGIKTSGLQVPDFFPPIERHGITIVAILN